MPSLVSSNWLGWALGFLIFAFYEVLTLTFRGWQDMKQRWKQNVGIGLLAAVGGYAILFGASTIDAVYNDHHDSTARWQSVVNEKNSLKQELNKRDQYIRDLRQRQEQIKREHQIGRPYRRKLP